VTPLYACLRPAQRAGDMPALDAALAVARDFSPRLHRYNNDCVVLDIGGLGRLLGDPQTIGHELAQAYDARSGNRDSRQSVPRPSDWRESASRASDPRESASRASDPRESASHETDPRQPASRETHPRIAVAPTQLATMLLSAAHAGLTVIVDDIASALAQVHLEVLRQVVGEMYGVTLLRGHWPSRSRPASFTDASAQAFATLARWGLTTLGELAALPAGALSVRLGQAGVALQRMATGVDPGPLVPDPEVPRFLERIELEWPIDGLEPLAFVLARLLEPLSSALERADRGAAAIHLDLRLVDRTRHVRTLQLPAAMRDPRVLRTLLVLDLESHPPHAAIDIVTIEIDPAPGRIIQYSLLERARPSAETVATLMARLGALVGDSRCGQPALLDSYGPDAFEMRRFASDESGAVDPRRVHQLETAVLRRFRPPVAIRVTVDRGRPSYVFIDRRGMPGGDVRECAGPWRSFGAWWKESSEVPGVARPWNRDEWDVALSDGAVCRLFQARDTERWFLDGVMD